MNLKERARQLKTDIPALFLALKDKETPIIAKILAGVIVIYALSPVDLIPDFIPVLGYLDDLIILPGLVAITIKLIPTEVMNSCREDASDLVKSNNNWLYALPFLAIWLFILYGILKLLF